MVEIILKIQIKPEGFSSFGAKLGFESLENGCLSRLARSDQQGNFRMVEMLCHCGHESTLYIKAI